MNKEYLTEWYQKKIDEPKESAKNEKDFAKKEYAFFEIAAYEQAINKIR